MIIKENAVVSVHYELKGDDGQVIESSRGQEPLVYLHGADNIIVGLENELTGKKPGDQFSVSIEPEDGYGFADEELVQQLPASAFEGDINEIEVGMHFEAETDEGPLPVVVTSIEDGLITIDGNHPLAGMALHFDVSVTDVREASEEEIDLGQPHFDDEEE